MDLDDIFNEINAKLIQFQDLFKQIQVHGDLENINKQLTLEDQAKLNATLSFALNSIYYVYMKTNGISIEDHKIISELDRIKQYFTKIQQQINKAKFIEEQKNINKTQIDILAAQNIIQRQLDSNNSQSNQNKKQKNEDNDIWKNQQQILKKSKKSQRIHKGALMPKNQHLSWKQQLENIRKSF